MQTLVQDKIWGTWIIQEKAVREMPGSVTLVSGKPSRNLDRRGWDKTDRQFRFPHGVRGASTQTLNSNPARTRWLEANDVHTQFLDAGIGCCWFAQQGDKEPVCGETEDEAIARLARENGIELWGERANITSDAAHFR